jgi:RNA-binding protein
MTLSGSQRRHLRGLAHHLKPVVHIGQAGVTEPTLAEVEKALLSHELIKVRLPAGDREGREEWLRAIEDGTGAETVSRVGHVATFYRAHPEEEKRQIRVPN